ncbi:MAG TPA: hypothetical protein VMY39_04350, partial [Planctomycetota bacterium]|nr:hypothetical protein [Planctomycetota bacterium]
WVKDMLDRGYAELEQGKLGEAEAWFKQARSYVWPSEQSLVRKLEDVIFQLERKRVAGVYVKVARVRMASAEEIAKELFKEVREKLVREDFLMVKLDSMNDPKGRQLQRVLQLDYHEDLGGTVTPKPGVKVKATKITCDLKLTVPGAEGELWSTQVYRETGPVDPNTPGGITEKTLRDNAAVLFWNAFVSVSLPRNLLFH